MVMHCGMLVCVQGYRGDSSRTQNAVMRREPCAGSHAQLLCLQFTGPHFVSDALGRVVVWSDTSSGCFFTHVPPLIKTVWRVSAVTMVTLWVDDGEGESNRVRNG